MADLPAHTRSPACCGQSQPWGSEECIEGRGLRQRNDALVAVDPLSRGGVPQQTQSLSRPPLRGPLLGWDACARARVYICFPVLSHQGLPLATVYVFLLFIALCSNPLPQVLSAVLLLKCILNFVLFLFWQFKIYFGYGVPRNSNATDVSSGQCAIQLLTRHPHPRVRGPGGMGSSSRKASRSAWQNNLFQRMDAKRFCEWPVPSSLTRHDLSVHYCEICLIKWTQYSAYGSVLQSSDKINMNNHVMWNYKLGKTHRGEDQEAMGKSGKWS